MKAKYLKEIDSCLYGSEEYLPNNLRRHLAKASSNKTKFIIETEIKCYELFLSKGQLKPVFQVGDRKWTDVSKLDNEEVKYIKARARQNLNPILKARYNHIVFLATKHNQFSYAAINSYAEAADIEFNRLQKKEICILDFMEILRTHHNLSTSTKTNTSDIRDKVIYWYRKPDQERFYYQCLVELITESKAFKPQHTTGMTDEMLSLVNEGKPGFDNEYFLKAVLNLAVKEKANLFPIYELLAEDQLEFARHRNDETNIITISCYRQASYYFKLAKNETRSNEVLRKIDQLKKDVKLSSISTSIEIPIDAIEPFHKLAQSFINSELNPFIHLALSSNILTTSTRYLNKPKKLTFLDAVTVSSFDANVNTKILSDYDKRMQEVFWYMRMNYEFCTLTVVRTMKKIMEENNRDYLLEGLEYFGKTWFNAELKQIKVNDEGEHYKWLSMLTPAFKLLLNLPHNADRILNEEEQMAFDQLAIKFEGLLRDLYELSNLTITKIKENQVLALDINELLQVKGIDKHFEKKDIEFWQFVFTGAGYNIRNNVAHSFYRPQDYTIKKGELVILAYILLAKYGKIVDNLQDRSR